jgi:hypothetical protein
MLDKDQDLNNGVQIILTRMNTHPEEFFDDGGRWKWIFKDTLREVLTEIEKAAIYEGLKVVRRLEVTAKAAATVLKADEAGRSQEKADGVLTSAYGTAISGATGTTSSNFYP